MIMKPRAVLVMRTGVATAALAATLLVLVQTSQGRSVLGGMLRMAHGACPFGYDRSMTGSDRERAQRSFARTHRGEQRAASRPALGFTLERTTRAQVLAQMTKHGVACTSGTGHSDLICANVSADTLADASAPAGTSTLAEWGRPARRNLWFNFGAREQLLSVVSIARDAQPLALSEAFLATRRALDQQVGSVTATRGDASAPALAQGLLRQASAEFRYQDYYALARVANLGKEFVLTEEYRSLAD